MWYIQACHPPNQGKNGYAGGLRLSILLEERTRNVTSLTSKVCLVCENVHLGCNVYTRVTLSTASVLQKRRTAEVD